MYGIVTVARGFCSSVVGSSEVVEACVCVAERSMKRVG